MISRLSREIRYDSRKIAQSCRYLLLTIDLDAQRLNDRGITVIFYANQHN